MKDHQGVDSVDHNQNCKKIRANKFWFNSQHLKTICLIDIKNLPK